MAFSLFNKLLGWLGVKDLANDASSFAGSVVGNYNQASNAHLTGAEQEANQFSAQQAQIAREWQENMYNQYESPKAMVNQYRAAGLNPALMYGSGASSGSVGSSPAPSSVGHGSAEGASGILGAISNLAMMKAQIENINADTRNKDANSYRTISLTSHEIDNIASQIAERNSGISVNEAQARVLDGQALLNSIDAETRSALNQAALVYQSASTEHAKASAASAYSNVLVNKANAGKLNQEAINAAEQLGLIRYEKEQAEFVVNHQAADRHIRNGVDIVNAVDGLGGLAVKAIGLGKFKSLSKAARGVVR